MDGLTRQQAACKAFVGAYLAANEGVSPTYVEIGVALGLKSRSSVHRLVMALIARGHLERGGNTGFARARALRVVQRACPHCGSDLDAPPLLPPNPRKGPVSGHRVTHIRSAATAAMGLR